jgi:dihydroorotate dehydrogenase electron transfer subunit
LVLEAPRIAARSKPGSFVHLTPSHLPMRRPLSLQSVDVGAGTIEILYKAIGEGTRRLAVARVGDTLSCMGPIGNGFTPDPDRPRALLIGGGVGLPQWSS